MPDELRSPSKHHLVLHRIDPEQGVRRFYSLMIERDLFGTVCLVCNWGRIGTPGQPPTHSPHVVESAPAHDAKQMGQGVLFRLNVELAPTPHAPWLRVGRAFGWGVFIPANKTSFQQA
jgi:predicted DNA-binding WGR domain protein